MLLKSSLFPTFLVVLTASNILAAPTVTPRTSKKLVSFTDAFSEKFPVKRSSYVWTSGNGGEDGYYLTTETATNSLISSNIETGETDTLLLLNDVKDPAENVLEYWDFEIQPSRSVFLGCGCFFFVGTIANLSCGL